MADLSGSYKEVQGARLPVVDGLQPCVNAALGSADQTARSRLSLQNWTLWDELCCVDHEPLLLTLISCQTQPASWGTTLIAPPFPEIVEWLVRALFWKRIDLS